MRGVSGYVHTGTINRPITITPQITGRLDPRGTINTPLPISASISGDSTTIDSLYGELPIAFAAIGISGTTEGTIDKEIVISASINASRDFREGTIEDVVVPISFEMVGNLVSNGTIEKTIVVAPKSTNRARSFLSVGEPVPQSFRHGSINVVVPITSEIVIDDTLSGIIESEIVIETDINTTRGEVLGRGGVIEAQIVIEGFLADSLYGVTVGKLETGAVIYDLVEGINIAKLGGLAVTGLPSGNLSVGKTVAYAVIGPDEATATDNYRAILFF